ncbi:threonine/serine dehydratase [uncultured Chloroflexus sp.]|uniref:threonine ammonia-lyase n=1 Tax=uncultured Chloroflexus sp. TaxID=214040 RepID=UPI0026255869|nr:threonine/serine dehydratase [uncultured Chloroflexus sp.]
MQLPITPADILAARRRIAGIVQPTPLELSRPLSTLIGAEVWLKLELAQVTGSFKLRGAANALRQLPPSAHIVACSAGNHALGVAHAAAMTGHAVTLVVPATASPAKIAALHRYPVELILYGDDYAAAEAEALRLVATNGWQFVSPYNDPAVIAGQGTLAVEVWEELPTADTVIVAVGGGGLASGVGIWAKSLDPRIRVIGVQAAASAAMAAALHTGKVVPMPDEPTLADGLAGGIDPATITLPILQQTLDEMVLVEEAAIARAMRWLLDEHHLIAEGSAAVPLAALLEGQIGDLRGRQIVVLICGRNVASATLQQIVMGGSSVHIRI